MPHVITQPCIGTKDASCVEVCPVECIHPMKDSAPAEFEAAEQLYINPDVCIDCRLCVDECPVQAIYMLEDLPAELDELRRKERELLSNNNGRGRPD